MGMIERAPGMLVLMALLVLAELWWRVRTARGYDRRTAFATLGLVIGNIPFAALHAAALGTMFGFAWRLAPVHWPIADWRTWAAGFVAVEFAYYGFHRASHRIRWLWASHAVHHSAEQMTLLASLRLGWTNLFSAGWIFYLPLVLAGFDPRIVFTLLAINLRYQFFLHTEAVGRLGPIEWIFNTPAHHRVHHASNDLYVDRNYGGMLILFDRLFGTLAEERADEPLRYGLAHRRATHNPIALAFGEWRAMFAEMRRAPSIMAAARLALSPPPATEKPE